MDTKKILGTVLISLGLLGLVPGILGIFDKQEMMGLNPWALTILGGSFYMSGVGIVQSIRSRTDV